MILIDFIGINFLDRINKIDKLWVNPVNLVNHAYYR
jgi:hypothetical protein